MAVRNFLDLSTAHLTPETRTKFEDGEGPALSYPHPDGYGWFVYVSTDPETDDQYYPEDLRKCFEHARSLDCDYLLFDCDGPELEGLPSYGDEEETETNEVKEKAFG